MRIRGIRESRKVLSEEINRDRLLELIEIEDKLITINDARLLYRGCIPGWKTFAEQHGLEWKDVVKHGLKASELFNFNDAMADEIIRSKYE